VRRAALALVVVLSASACYTESQPVSVEESKPAPPPAPPCIKEVCAQRPGWLLCETPYTGLCGKYRIAYEHHCDCVEWGPLPDGGAK
jgi:hypothetical protein